MKIAEVMDRTVESCGQDSELAAISGRMTEQQMKLMAVVGSDGDLKGFVTDDSVSMYLALRDREDKRLAKDVMRPPVAVWESWDNRAALRIMSRLGVNALPVTNRQGRLLGVVTLDKIWASVYWDSSPGQDLNHYVELL